MSESFIAEVQERGRIQIPQIIVEMEKIKEGKKVRVTIEVV